MKRCVRGLLPAVLWVGFQTAQALGVCDADNDGDVDVVDITIVDRALNTPSQGPHDARDVDVDGMITGGDFRWCLIQCREPDGSSCENVSLLVDFPAIEVNPVSFDFGEVAVGDSSTAIVTIGNSGTAALSVTAIETGGAPFSVSSPTHFTIDIGAPDQAVSLQFAPITEGDFAATVIITNNANIPQRVEVTGRGAAGALPLPPDPATVAPPLSATDITPMDQAVDFLYSGSAPIQTGVAEGTLEAQRIAVIRGRVNDGNGQPLSGVTVRIKDHPELGQTLSRADGAYDLAVNGGGRLTLDYVKAGYLPAQRQVETPWRDFAHADDVALVALDSQVTTIDLTDVTQPFQVAQGSISSDLDGSRQATLLFPQGTAATLTLPGGTTQPLTTLNVRATEYTVGDNGPQRMPGPLPSTSGYTYAVELSVDEAQAAGAERVDFDQPVPLYLDNFLDFPVGEPVPVGWYDRTKAAWIPADNGRIIQILAVTGGLADLDVDGDAVADTGTALTDLGITDAERQQLATQYSVGKSLWRVAINHFTPWDFNWPYGPPDGAEPPPTDSPGTPDEEAPEEPCEETGCIIQAETQVLGEDFPVAGTPFSLHYRSDRVKGRKTKNTLTVPLSGESVPADLARIDLTLTIAGRKIVQSFPALPNQTHTFEWDGKDAYGRNLTSSQKAQVDIGYVYQAYYYAARTDFARSFSMAGRPSDGGSGGSLFNIIGQREERTVTLNKRWEKTLIPPREYWEGAGLGGMGITIHHSYDPVSQTLYLGDGSARSAKGIGSVITTVAGGGEYLPHGDEGVPATQAILNSPEGIALAPDGTLYIADAGTHRIRQVTPDGTIMTIAGTAEPGFSGDGGSAVQAQLDTPRGVALGPDGTLYIADYNNCRIRRIAPDGIITTLALPFTHKSTDKNVIESRARSLHT